MTADISGGAPPYKYTVTFTGANAITGPPATNVDSTDGKINRTFKIADVAALAGKPVGFTITATDKNKKEVKND